MNKIFESISASLGELINRSFITAGLAPGLLLAASWSLYRNGLGGTRKAVETGFQSGEKFLETFGWWVILILLLAWILVAAGRRVQGFLSDPPLWKLRDWMLQRELSRRAALHMELSEWLEGYGPLKWQQKEERFVVLIGDEKLTPPTYDMPGLGSKTKEAREILEKDGVLSAEQLRKLADALRPLWLAARWPKATNIPDELSNLLSEWQEWMRKDPARGIRLDAAAEQAEREVHRAYIKTRDDYPRDPTWVQPTRFGNRLAALDDYAHQRYGIDTSTLWSRLWGVLEDKQQDEFRNAEQGVTALVNMWLVFCLLAVAMAVAEVLEVPRVWGAGARIDVRAIGFMLGAALLAFLAYSAAVTAVGGMAEVMYRWIDLKRLDLLKALGLEPPRTVAEEATLFKELESFYAQAAPVSGWRKLRIEASS